MALCVRGPPDSHERAREHASSAGALRRQAQHKAETSRAIESDAIPFGQEEQQQPALRIIYDGAK